MSQKHCRDRRCKKKKSKQKNNPANDDYDVLLKKEFIYAQQENGQKI